MAPRRKKRLDPSVFQIPVETVRTGVYTDTALVRVRDLLRAAGRSPRVVLQFATKRPAVVCGVDEAVAVLKLCSDDWSALTVHALFEGDRADAGDTVLTVEGPYEAFAHLETYCVGVLARRSTICTTMRSIVDAARPKPVFVFSARSDHALMQPGDGWAAYVGGATGVSTDGQGSWWGGKGLGVVPHALIAAFGGDTVAATKAFAEQSPNEQRLIALCDYANDCVATSVAVARAMEGRLWGVRIDTSQHLVDKSILPLMGTFPPTGVNPQLVWNVRNALDDEGFGDVRIVVSGGFSIERIRAFEEDGVPVDAYGVGSSLYAAHLPFTADIVQVDGRPQAKAGREARANPKLERVK
jgi:nicotinate phosphoribosyltransferase